MLPASAWAAPADNKLSLVSVALSLLAVLAVIFIVAALLRRLNNSWPVMQQDMRIIRSLPLGPRQKLVVVELQGRQLLLGVTEQNIRLLSTLTQQLPPVAGKAEAQERGDA